MSTTQSKSITIVIPTRERSDTLFYAIQSCVVQTYSNLKILIVDNFSQDNTAAVVGSFSDERIDYINSGRRLSMSANWEFALHQVDSDYVMFIGDDDGVLPGAIIDLMTLVSDNGPVDAITWPSAEYGWPSCQNNYLRNTIVIPLAEEIEKRKTRKVLREVISFKRPYSELPFIYKGLINTDVIKRLRTVSGGSIFHSMIPDVYFGIASCSVIEEYLYTYHPYTMNGASHHSNGTSSFSPEEGKKAKQLFLAEDNIPFHSSLPYCSSIPILITESLMQAKLRLPSLEMYPVDMDSTIMAAVSQLERADPNIFHEVMTILRSIAENTSLQSKTKHALTNTVNRPFLDAKRVYGSDIFHKRLIVDCTEYQISDCYTAGIITDLLLKLNRNGELSTLAAIKNSVRLLVRELTKRTGWFQ